MKGGFESPLTKRYSFEFELMGFFGFLFTFGDGRFGFGIDV